MKTRDKNTNSNPNVKLTRKKNENDTYILIFRFGYDDLLQLKSRFGTHNLGKKSYAVFSG